MTGNPKFAVAAILTYIACFLIVWDKSDVRHSISLVALTVAAALLLALLLYAIRKPYNNSMKVRVVAGIVLLLTYMVSGLVFRGLLFHVLFCMTLALTASIASFFMDLESPRCGRENHELGGTRQ